MFETRLTGLDGSNLLGFLAALGTLRVLEEAADGAEVRMAWRLQGRWMPVIQHSALQSEEEFLSALGQRICGESSVNSAWNIGNDLTLPLEAFRDHLFRSAGAGSAGREEADFLAAFGSDGVGAGPKKDQMSDTEFRTMSGAGHQHFLGFLKELAAGTDTEHLRRTLFESWDYADGRPSLRWDPADYRPHALRAEDPAGDPIRTMRGANRLAVEALPLFPTAAVRGRLNTVGFEDRNREPEVTWPIWKEPVGRATVASLLALEELQAAQVGERERRTLERRGLGQVFRAKRFTEGKYRNFSPARALL